MCVIHICMCMCMYYYEATYVAVCMSVCTVLHMCVLVHVYNIMQGSRCIQSMHVTRQIYS